jgi:hypothetical protein
VSGQRRRDLDHWDLTTQVLDQVIRFILRAPLPGG